MESETPDNAQTPPLSLWQKVKIGTKAFVKTAINYIPTGLLWTGAFFGGSALLGMASPKLDLLNALHPGSAANLIKSMAISFGLGTGISAIIGAGTEVYNATHPKDEPAQAQGAQVARAQTPQRAPEITGGMNIVAPGGLPPKPVAKNQTVGLFN